MKGKQLLILIILLLIIFLNLTKQKINYNFYLNIMRYNEQLWTKLNKGKNQSCLRLGRKKKK